jgi:hypothetical protein
MAQHVLMTKDFLGSFSQKLANGRDGMAGAGRKSPFQRIAGYHAQKGPQVVSRRGVEAVRFPSRSGGICRSHQAPGS